MLANLLMTSVFGCLLIELSCLPIRNGSTETTLCHSEREVMCGS